MFPFFFSFFFKETLYFFQLGSQCTFSTSFNFFSFSNDYHALDTENMFTVRIKDLLKDPDDFRRYLTEDMDMNSKVADAIVDGTLSFELVGLDVLP